MRWILILISTVIAIKEEIIQLPNATWCWNTTLIMSDNQWGVSRDNGTNNILMVVRVVPSDQKTMIEDVIETETIVRLQSKKVSGKANRKLTNFLSYILDVNRTEVFVVNGQESKLKTVAIARENFTVPSVVRWIAQYLPPPGIINVGVPGNKGVYRRSN